MKKIRKICTWLLLCTLFAVFGTTAYAETAAPDIDTVIEDMTAKFDGTSIKNTSKTNVTTYWSMLAAKSLGLSKVTETDYDAVDYKSLGIQVIAKFIIAMVNDGVNPGDYYVDNLDLVEYLCSCIGEDGGYRNRLKAKPDSATASTQATVLQALAVVGADVPQEAADFLSQYQNDDGIFSNAFGTDPDSTSWCMSACRLLGIDFPNAAKAEKALSYMVTSMNGNSFGCYADYLSVCGDLAEQDIRYMIENHYSDADPSNKGFLYNGKVNNSATQQCSIPLGEYASGKSIYEILKEESLYEKNDGIRVSVRVASAEDASLTEDIVKREELTVEKGSSYVLTGITDTFETVTLADVLTEAVCFELLGHDPDAAEISENAAAINEVLAIENTDYGYAIKGLYGSDGVGYYLNREEMAWNIVDPVQAGDDVFFFIYDYLKSAYAVFDEKDYEGTTEEAPVVTVKKQEYDAEWNPVFTPVPATVTAKNDLTETDFICGEDGKAELTGLEEGVYDLSAHYTDDDGIFIVSPYASVTINKAEEPEDEPEDEPEEKPERRISTGGGYQALPAAPFASIGSVSAPVSGGTWTQDASGAWSYKIQEALKNCWAYIANPYAGEGQPGLSWFLFDASGKMLTGWRLVNGKWYYLNPLSDGTLGACQLGGVTPDGYTLDESGAWIESVPRAGQYAEAESTVNKDTAAVISSGSSSGSSSGNSTKEKSGTVKVSVSAGATTLSGEKIKFSSSKSYKIDDVEGMSAYDVLCLICEKNDWDIEGDSDYVSGINGLCEFDCGENSGWMYSINGKYPNVPAGDVEVEEGMSVKWVYVTKMVNTTDEW